MDTTFFEIRTIINSILLLLFHLPFSLYFLSKNEKYRLGIVVLLSLGVLTMLCNSIYRLYECSPINTPSVLEFFIFHTWLLFLTLFLILNHLNKTRIFSKVITVVYIMLCLHVVDMIYLNQQILNTGLVYNMENGKYIQSKPSGPIFPNRVYLNENKSKELIINCGFDFGTNSMTWSQFSVTFYLYKYTVYM